MKKAEKLGRIESERVRAGQKEEAKKSQRGWVRRWLGDLAKG
jgi:hypothetical protein